MYGRCELNSDLQWHTVLIAATEADGTETLEWVTSKSGCERLSESEAQSFCRRRSVQRVIHEKL